MKRKRTTMLNFRAPALVDRKLTYLSGMQCLGQVTVVCFLPYLRIIAAQRIDHVAEGFLTAGARFLIVACDERPLHRGWNDQTMPCTPIIDDLCGRLHRAFGITGSEPLSRCRSFVIDGTGQLRLQFTHDFTGHDCAAIRELVTMDRLHFGESALGPATVGGKAEHAPI